MTKGLLLDLDDTLYPHQRFVASGHAAVAAHVALRHGIDSDDVYAFLARRVGTPAQATVFQSLCERYELPVDGAVELLDVYRSHEPLIWLRHGVADALRSLRAGGWRLAVLTNGLPRVQVAKVDALGLREFVDDVVYAEEHAAGGKPAPAPFFEALRRLDVTASRAVMVGDDRVCDVHGARNAGLRTIRLDQSARRAMAGPDTRSEAGVEADLVIERIDQLPLAAAALLEGVVSRAA